MRYLGRVAPLAAALALALPATTAMAGTALVFNNNNDGPGSFRATVEQANGDPSIGTIIFRRNVGTIGLEDTVEYTGTQDLRIEGRGSAMEPSDRLAFDLFVASGGGDLTLRRLVFQNGGGNGVVVLVPADAEGEQSVAVSHVEFHGNGLFGLLVDDQPDLDNKDLGSDASVNVDMSFCSFTGNGVDDIDFDGARVQEGGMGDITVSVSHCKIDENGGDGLELDEGGDGDVALNVRHTSFDANGFQDPSDLDDGLDIDEEGEGDVWFRIADCSANGNYDQGFDFDEADGGSAYGSIVHCEASDNLKEGVKIDEEDDGNLVAKFRSIVVDNNGHNPDPTELQQGMQLEEADDGDFDAEITHSRITNNEEDGLKVEQGDGGAGTLRLVHVLFRGNGDEAVDADGITVTTIP